MAAYDSDARSVPGGWKRSHGVLGAALLLAGASPVHALTVLTAAKIGHFDNAASRPPSAFVRVTNDPGLATAHRPEVPDGVRGRILVREPVPGTDGPRRDEPSLRAWQATRRGFRYREAAGSAAGVQEIV